MTSAVAMLLAACGGNDDLQGRGSAAATAWSATVTGADNASVRFRALDVAAARQVTVRVARDATGAPPLDSTYARLGEVYQFTPLGWVQADIEIRVPFTQSALDTATPQLLISMPGVGWSEVPAAWREGDFMVARVPHLAHATVVSRVADSVAGRVKALATGAATGRSLTLNFDAQGTTPALPAPNADGIVTIVDNTTLALELAYALPSGCAVAPRVGAYAAVWQPATQKLRTVQLGEQAVNGNTGRVSFRLPLSAADNGTWVFASTALCKEPGRLFPRYAFAAAGPVLSVKVSSDPAAPLPTIVTAPQDINAIDGDVVSFGVAAQGEGLAYEWQRSRDGGVTYVAVPGATAQNLVFTASLADDASLLRVRVTNANGSVTSTPARLTVAQRPVAPSVIGDPSSQTVIEGQSASFTVAAAGTPAPDIQWQQRPAAMAGADDGWLDIAGANSATYTTPPTGLSQSGSQYRAVLSNGAGRATTAAATLRVEARVIAPSIVTAPTSQTVEQGQSALFSVVASGTSPLSYQWFRNGQAITGANAAEVLVAGDAADVGSSIQITVQVSNSAGTVTSVAASLTVTATPPATGTLIKASDGGVVQGGAGLESDPVLEVPAGALAQDTRITLVSESSTVAGLPAEFVPLGDVINVGPDGLTFSQPATLSLPVPDVDLDGKVLALVLLEGPVRAQAASGRRTGQAAINLRRLADAKKPAAGVRILAAGDVVTVLCGTAANGVGGRFNALLGAGARVLQVGVPAGACAAFAPAPPLGGVPSDSDIACSSDQEFVGDSGNTDGPDKALVSRHVECRASVSSTSVDVWATLTENPKGTFKHADPSLPNNGNWSSYKMGTVRSIETQFTAYGPPNRLYKTYRIRLRALGYVADPDYPGPLAGRNTIVVRPRVSCTVDSQSPATCKATVPEIDVPLNGNWSDARDFKVTFDWTLDPGQLVDMRTFFVNMDAFEYTIKGATFERAPDRSEPQFYFSGYGYAPALRCDRKVAQAASDGCVFVDAAPVYVLSKAPGSDVLEAAEHIFEAQNNPDPARRAPGKWLLKPGTRALADNSVVGGLALQRAKSSTVQEENRKKSCSLSTSLFNTRLPLNQSASCAAGKQVCSCDEYPFASTWNGGNFDPDHTSAKRINDAHNNLAGGGRLTGFYTRQRVLDFTLYPDQVQPYDPSAESNRGGDSFWVHIK